jgi:hypothetical protein
MLCTKCGKTWVPGDATVCSSCAPSSSAPAEPPLVPPPGGFVGRMVPTGNKPALVGYYFAIASALPTVGVFCVPVAVVCGIVGVRRVRQHPEARGGGHAWFAIIGGLVLGAVGVGISMWMHDKMESRSGW